MNYIQYLCSQKIPYAKTCDEKGLCVVVYLDSATVYLERAQPEDIEMEQTLQMLQTQTEKRKKKLANIFWYYQVKCPMKIRR